MSLYLGRIYDVDGNTPFGTGYPFPFKFTGTDYTSTSFGIDAATGVQTGIDYPHHEIHDGNHYYMEGFTTLASNASLYVKLQTPNTTTWSHFTWQIESSGILTTRFWENPTGSSGGTTMTALNNNRNSTNNSGMVIVSDVTAPSITGTIIAQKKVGGTGFKQVTGGSAVREDELMLKQDTSYVRQFLSGSDDNIISFKAMWYEHSNKN